MFYAILRKITVIGVFVSLGSSSILYAQEGEYTVRWLLHGLQTVRTEDEVAKTAYLRFENAEYDDHLIPSVSRSFQITKDDFVTSDYIISEVYYEPFPDSILQNIEIPYLGKGNSSIEISKGASSYYLDVRLDGVRKNPENGAIERLIWYRIDRVIKNVTISKNEMKIFKSSENSLLSSGRWYKFKVFDSDIYKITYKELTELGFSNPENVSLYGFGGQQLSYFNGDPRPSGLQQIPVYIHRGADNTFNAGDYILCYLEGPVTWTLDTLKKRFTHQKHQYSDAIFYLLTDSKGAPLEIPDQQPTEKDVTNTVSTYDEYYCLEEENYNLIGSGRQWFTSRFDEAGENETYHFEIENFIENANVTIEARLAARSGEAGYASMLLNNKSVERVLIPAANMDKSYYWHARQSTLEYTFKAESNELNLRFEYAESNFSDKAWLDYITVNARAALKMHANKFFFRDKHSAYSGNITKFVIANTNPETQVWDITQINDIQRPRGERQDGKYVFTIQTDDLRQFVALDPTGIFSKPVLDASEDGVGWVDNQNLRGLDLKNYLIISHDAFLDQAERLAQWHRETNNLSVEVVTPQQIYNEFSSGTPDVSAIRDFIRQHYQKNSSNDSLRFVQLFGDGSYCNHLDIEGNTNYIPTYQSINSFYGVHSYTSDDFYGLLDENEGGMSTTSKDYDLTGKLDVAIGRLPVKETKGNKDEAKDMVDKIISYRVGTMGDWRRMLCFTADDEEGATYMINANELASRVSRLYPGYEYKKILLDAYKQESNATGAFYPEATKDLLRIIDRGVLVVSYFGHGSENQLSDERLIQKSDIKALKNKYLPLIITATCQFSRYDHVEIESPGESPIVKPATSAGEEALLNPDGGAVALLTTSRVVTGPANQGLTSALFSSIFKKDYYERQYSIGESFMIAKNSLPDQVNKLNFCLLGDPALKLAFPQLKVLTDSINFQVVGQVSDTLKAFSEVTISGYVARDDSAWISDFNGVVYPRVYDKEIMVSTLANDRGEEPYEYIDRPNLIYKGKATVRNGRFRFTFRVPKDISYSLGKGKISYYAENGELDGCGEFKDVLVGGTSSDIEMDYSGPEINLFMNNENFEDGGITNANPFLLAHLYDDNGINTTGNGIGHDIVAVLNHEPNKAFVLNDYYEADIDKYTSGTVRYQLFDLEEGEYTLNLKAWDIFNNSSENSINFYVKESKDPILEKVLTFPNPASTSFSVQYSHNSPGTHVVTLRIFNMSGQLVGTLSRTEMETGFISMPLTWNLQLPDGTKAGPGVYIYQLQVETDTGKTSISEKLIIIR